RSVRPPPGEDDDTQFSCERFPSDPRSLEDCAAARAVDDGVDFVEDQDRAQLRPGLDGFTQLVVEQRACDLRTQAPAQLLVERSGIGRRRRPANDLEVRVRLLKDTLEFAREAGLAHPTTAHHRRKRAASARSRAWSAR